MLPCLTVGLLASEGQCSLSIDTVILLHVLMKIYMYKRKGKGKVHPRTGHEGPEGE